MDKQDTLRNLLIAAAVFMVVLAIGPRLMPPPQPVSPEEAVPTTTTPTPAAPEAGSDSAPVSAERPATTEPTTTPYVVVEAEQEAAPVLGAAAPPVKGEPSSPYRMEIQLSSVGASVSSVKLSDHAQEVRRPERYELLSPVSMLDGTTARSFAIEKINIDGHDVFLGDKRWSAGPVEPFRGDSPLAGADAEGERVAFWIEIHADDAPAVRLTRTFELPRQPSGSGLHDAWSLLTVENLSATPHRVIVTSRGPLNVPGGNGRFGAEAIDFGIATSGGGIVGERKSPSEAAGAPGSRLRLYRFAPDSPHDRLSWVAIDNTYFTATMAPVGPDGGYPATYIAEAAAVDLDALATTSHDTTVELVTTPQTLEPGASVDLNTEFYLGGKDRDGFRTVERYASRNYYFQIAAGLSWCTFNWLVEVMVWLLNHLYFVVRDFGIAIVILVLIVRTLLHPITKKGQINMVRMQQQMSDFAPKLEEMRKKYANDKARLQQETMKLYRDHGVNPAGQMLTCLPMFIQMPIWVALFYSLSNNILMRHEPLHLTWIHDLTAPDALYTFASPVRIPVVGWEIASFNLLPLLVAIFMYIQQKTIPKPEPNPNMSEQQRAQQEMMQKMMPMMSIMMLLIFYSMPAGLNLYIMFSSLFGWLEQNHIRKHIKAQKEAGEFIKPKRAAAGPENGKPRLPGWLERLQKAAEDAQKSQRTQGRGKSKRKR